MANYNDIGALRNAQKDIGAVAALPTNSNTGNTFSDFYTLTDSFLLIENILLSFTDTVTYSEFFQVILPTMNFTFTDTIGGAYAANTPFQDGLTAVENCLLTFADTFTLSDNFQPTVTLGITLILSDTYTLTDTLTTQLNANLTEVLADSISITDTFNLVRFGNLFLTFSDPLSFSDAFSSTVIGKIGINLAEARIVFSDFISLMMPMAMPLSDSYTISDSFAFVLTVPPVVPLNMALNDALSSFTDTFTFTVAVGGILLSDTLVFADFPFVMNSPDKVMLVDNLVFDDSNIQVLLKSTLNSYLRRYLNDVI